MATPKGELILGGADTLIRPDAIEDFTASTSIETDIRCRIIGKEIRPTGHVGEAVARRIYVSGYSRASIAMYITPIVNGRYRNDLRRFFSKPAPDDGQIAAFRFILPMMKNHPDYPNRKFGVRGSGFASLVEIIDPSAEIRLTGWTLAVEPLNRLGRRSVREAGTSA